MWGIVGFAVTQRNSYALRAISVQVPFRDAFQVEPFGCETWFQALRSLLLLRI